ncbi:hypothetical protein BGZ65_002201 [Modicella reniformis]|uniref:DUF7137 domain-containing protein n=1 Tax=Modicella reniformis TaxID=1440133 RepID=A0A9P6MKZ1_9FUNG|nr:hypothetical protein BGZ65_002201 [Modicella reniformis]
MHHAPSSTSTTAPASTSSGVPTGTTSGSASGATTGTGTASGTASGSASGTAAPLPSATRSPQDPVSQLSMLKPLANAQNPPLFPIGVDILFQWQYDKYLKLQPSNLTIEAYMNDSPNTIVTIGNVSGTTTSYIWPAASQNNDTHPLKTSMYTLRIFDGQVGRAGNVPPGGGGYLATYIGLKFGLYRPDGYTPGNQQNPPICATCAFASTKNDAMRTLLPAFSVLALTAITTLILA